MAVAQLAPRWLRRVAVTLTLPIEPSEQDRNGSWVEAQAVPGTRYQAKLGCTMSLGQLSSIDSRHTVVVVAMHHQQRPWRQPPSSVDRPEPA